jgi:hypothetical protein
MGQWELNLFQLVSGPVVGFCEHTVYIQVLKKVLKFLTR